MSGHIGREDEDYLKRAIQISEDSLSRGGTPFGALIVVNGVIVGEGESSVVERWDPTAHAEVMALREAGAKLKRHLFEDGVMYASSEPCPMCLAACLWARIPRLIYGASSLDVARSGFEDVQFYRELAQPTERRTLIAEAASNALHGQALEVLTAWVDRLPEPVQPKL
ncbi:MULTISPECIES: nucleoside deaminase [Streptomyces]|uniref:nucleoside deaminase n=1 Tax=Streptomyces TaxID=1883 RepID=UPI0015CF6974|nr:nucleoside deaminase [Streptomyces sp. b62]WST52946.1 nucleoside deaminase [Streptomyces rubiginosohelvolus]